jgi:hypothetical protein
MPLLLCLSYSTSTTGQLNVQPRSSLGLSVGSPGNRGGTEVGVGLTSEGDADVAPQRGGFSGWLGSNDYLLDSIINPASANPNHCRVR